MTSHSFPLRVMGVAARVQTSVSSSAATALPHANFTHRILIYIYICIISYLSLPDVFRQFFVVVVVKLIPFMF